jgi:hypothetical protein
MQTGNNRKDLSGKVFQIVKTAFDWTRVKLADEKKKRVDVIQKAHAKVCYQVS